MAALLILAGDLSIPLLLAVCVARAMGLATPVGVAIGGALAEVMGIAPFFLVDDLVCLALGLVLYLPKSARAGRGVGTSPVFAKARDNARK